MLISTVRVSNLLEPRALQPDNSMNIDPRAACVTIGLVLTSLGSLAAQDQYASAVGVVGEDVLVVKPAYGRGPAAVVVYRRDSGGLWREVERLRPEGGESTGESFSPSMAFSDGVLLVGGADADGRLGAHGFRRSAGAVWGRAGDLPLITGGDGGPGQWNLAALMKIMQPPVRVLGADDSRALVAEIGGLGSVRIFERRSGSEAWTAAGRLERSNAERDDQFGASLSVAGDLALVGAPRHGDSGAVYVFSRDPRSGQWREKAMLSARGASPNSGFGTAVMIDDEVALVGLPGTAETSGIVITYAREQTTGVWREQGRIAPSQGSAGDRFGSAMALEGAEILIGAPGAEGGRGSVYQFVRSRGTEAWQAADVLSVDGVEPGFSFGSTVALGAGVAVAGAPGADGGRGRAGVFTRPHDGRWSTGDWLRLTRDLPMVRGEEVSCTDGQAEGFACSEVDLLAFLPLGELGIPPGGSGLSSGVTDVWGWTDPETRHEYALIGRVGGAAVVDITDPSAPVYVGLLAVEDGSAQDIKVYADHAFFIGAGNTGMPVFDLRRLRDAREFPVTLEADARYDGIAAAHNLVIDTQSGFAYPVGSTGGGDTCGGGLHMIDIRDPVTPTFVGCYTDTEGLIWAGRTHDAQCVEYSGPDLDFRGRQICFASNETALRIVDVTEKDRPVPLASASYPGMAYIHQGWLTDDQRYYYMNDELDELTGLAERTRTLVWDVAELDDPILVTEHFGSTQATDHNLYVRGDRMYQANYQAGLRILDITDPENPEEIGFFDTTPYEGNPPIMGGAWSVYPYFESGTLIVTSMQEGLFLLRPVRRPVF